MLKSRWGKGFLTATAILTLLSFLCHWYEASWNSSQQPAVPRVKTTTDKCPPGFFLTISAHGRLCNKVCQYATMWALQLDDARARPAWIMPEMQQEMERFFTNLELPVLPEVCTEKDSRFRSMWYQHFDKEVDVSDSPRRPVLLSNWPCDVNRFHKHQKSLFRQLTFRPDIVQEAQQRLRHHTASLCQGSPACTYIGVHVRRTDYHFQVKYMLNGSLVGETYLERALTLCRSRYRRPVFVVSSDEPDWVHQRLRGRDIVLAASQGDGSAGRDMALLAQCNHTVMTHGTYGFWMAYLAQGDVYAPTKYGARDSWLSEMMIKQGLNVTLVQAF